MDSEAHEFEVQILGAREVHELPGAWPIERLRRLLTRLEVEGVGDEDALEMAAMALQDLDVDEASDRVLEVVFAERMRPGVRQNLIPDLREDRPWEEFAEIPLQAGIFEAVTLLQRAFPGDFGKPDAVSLQLRLESDGRSAGEWLDAASPDAALLLRILAAGMGERAVLCRLFEEPLAGVSFPEAPGILWRAIRQQGPPPARVFELISSHQWLDGLEEGERFTARAWPDTAGVRSPG